MARYALRYAFLFALLALIGTALTTSAASRSWAGTGSTPSWLDPLNWNEGALTSGDFLSFISPVTKPANSNDAPGRVVGSLTFGPGTSGYGLGGASLFITNGISNSSSSALNTISNSISFATPSAVGLVQATQTVLNAVASGSGALVFKGFLTNSAPSGTAVGTNVLVFGGTGDFGVSNIITGVAGLIKNGAGNLTLGAANTYSGNTAAGALVDTFLLGGRTIATVNNVIPSGNNKGNLNITNAIFDLNGTSQQLSGINGDSTATVDNYAATAPGILAMGSGNSNSFWAGNITDRNYAAGATVTISNTGGGTTFLMAANTYHGQTKLSGGTISLTNNGTILNSPVIYSLGRTFRIDNNSTVGNLADRISDTTTIILDGGTLGFYNNAGAVSYNESLGTVIFTNGQNRIDASQAAAGQTSTLTINNVIRYGSAWGYFSGTGLGLDTRNRIIFNNPGALTNVAMQLLPSGAPLGIVPWAYSGGDDLQRWVSTNNLNSPALLVANDYALNIPETQWDITNNVRLGYGQTLTGSRTVSSLNLGASAVALTRAGALPLDLGGSSLRIASGALMFGGDQTGVFQITNGTLTAGIAAETPAELMIYTRNSGTAVPLNVGYSAPYIGSEIAASITDNGGGAVTVTKALGNLLVLSGNNTYSGGTTIANGGGTLIIGNGGTTGSVGTGDITNYSAEIYLNRSDDMTFPNVIRGTGGNFRKLNTNTVVMTADSSSYLGNVLAYSGLTPDTGKLVLANGGRITNAANIYVRRSMLVVSNTASANHGDRLPDAKNLLLQGGTLLFANDGSAANYAETLNGVTSDYGYNIVQTVPAPVGNSSVFTIKTITRNNSSTLNIIGDGLGTTTKTNNVALGGVYSQQNGTFNPAFIISGTEFAKYLTNTGISATSIVALASSDYALNTTETGWTNTQNVKLTDNPSASTGGDRVVNTLNLTNTALTLGGLLTISNAGILASGDADAAISGGTLNAGLTELIFHVMIPTNNGHALTVSSVITNQAKTGLGGALVKSGPGMLKLTGANIYTNSTIINGGVLSVGTIGDAGTSSPMGTNTSIVYLRGGTLQYTGSGTATTARPFDVQNNGGAIDVPEPNGNLTINAAVTGSAGNNYSDLMKLGAGTLTLGGTTDNNSLHANVQAGTLVLNKTVSGKALAGVSYVAPGATIKYGNTTYGDQILDSKNWGVLNMNGTLDLAGASDAIVWMTGSGNITNSASTPSFLTNGVGVASVNTLNITDGASGGSGTITLVKSGANILALSGNNTYSGKTLVQAGTLAIDDDSRLGAVPSSYVADQLTLGYSGTGGGVGTLQAARGNFSIATNRGITLATNGILEAAYGATMTINSIITGTNSLTKTGPGTVVLANMGNNWTNGLTVSGGTLKVGVAGVIPTGVGIANVTVNGGGMGIGTASIQPFGILDLNGFDTTVNGLTVNVTTPGVSGVVLNNAPNTTNTLTVGNANAGFTINGGLFDNTNNLGGVLTLRKIGTNTMILGNYTNNHSGGFIFENGRTDFTDDYSLGAVPATPTTNLVFNGGVIRNINTRATQIATNRTINLLAGGGYFLAAYQPGTLTINGRITGVGTLNFGFETSTNILTNPGNDYAGNTIVGNNAPNIAPSGTVPKLKLGASEVIPNGPGKGLLLLTNGCLVDMAGVTETVNGLGAWGSAVAGTIDNSIGNANLIVGDADTNSSFNGVIKNTGGTVSLTKIGAGTLTLSGVNTYSGGTTNAGGILNINADTALGNAAPLTFTGNSTLQAGANNISLVAGRTVTLNGGTATIDNQAYTMTINGPISGSGALTKIGSGTLSLNGASTYTGNTLVSDGVLYIQSTAQGGGVYSVNDNKTLAIGFSGAGQFVPMSSLTLGSSSGGTTTTLNFNGWAADTVNLNPSIWATNLTVNGTVIINVSGQLVAGVRIPLLKYTSAGDLSGLKLGALPRGVEAQLFTDIPGEVDIEVTSAVGIVWKGQNGSDWDIQTTANWLFSGLDAWYTNSPADAVTFGDGASQYMVNLTNIVSPLQVQFTNTDQPYTLVGTGVVSGAALLLQNSPLTNTISTSNDFTGGTIISAGVLKIANTNALGIPAGAYLANVHAGAALDLNGTNIDKAVGSTKPIFISGQLAANAGAIINSGGTLVNLGVKHVTLAGDAALGQDNTSRFDVLGTLNGNGHTLTKVGTNQIAIYYVASVVNVSNVFVNAGFLEVQVPLGGAPVVINQNAKFGIYSGTSVSVSNSSLTISNATFSNSNGSNNWTGPVTLFGTNTANITTPVAMLGAISGTGTFNKIGPGALVLASDNNDWSGSQTISAGSIQLGNFGPTGSLSTNGGVDGWSANVTNAANASLAFARSDDKIFTGVIYGAGGLIQRGPGKLRLSQAQQYTGFTTVSGGTLVRTAVNDIPSNIPLLMGETNLASAGTLDLSSYSLNASSLTVNSTNPLTANVILIGSGQTLAINGPVIPYPVAVTNVYTYPRLNVSGLGSFTITNIGGTIYHGGNINVVNANASGTWDLSALATSFVDLGPTGLNKIGTASGQTGTVNVTNVLATNSVIRAGTLQIDNNGYGGNATLKLGSGSNNLYASFVSLGNSMRTGFGYFQFNTGNGTVLMRDYTTMGRANLIISTNRIQAVTHSFDVRGHYADLLLNNLTLGTHEINNTPSGVRTANFFFDQGILDVTTIRMGIQIANTYVTNNPSLVANMALGGGIVNVGAGGITLTRNDNPTNGVNISAILSITNGAIVTCLGDILKGTNAGGTGPVTATAMVANASLILGGKLGSIGMPLDSLQLTNANLSLNALTANTNVAATTLSVGGANTIGISQLPPMSTTTTQLTLIKYTTLAGAYNFSLASGYRVPGYLSNNIANASIDLVLTNATDAQGNYPITWTGVKNGNWDINTSTNWLDFWAATATYLQPLLVGDGVRFDDSALAFTVNLTTNLAPTSLTISNHSQNYTFTGSGRITGATALIKHGAGSVTLGNNNTYTGGTIFTNGGGKIVIGANNALSTGAAIKFGSSGTLDLSGNSQTVSNLTFATATMTNVPALTNNFTAIVLGGPVASLVFNGANLNVGPDVKAETTAGITNTLDMAGLGNFVFNALGNTLRVGGYVSGKGDLCGVLALAATNSITALAVGVGDMSLQGPGNYTNAIHLGQANNLSVGSLNVGSTRQAHALMDFATTWTSPTLTLRGTNGPSSGVPNVWVGSQNNFGADNLYHVLDLSAGSVDAVIDTLTVGRTESRWGTEYGIFRMRDGTLTVTNLILGQGIITAFGFASNTVSGTFVLGGGTATIKTLTLADNTNAGVICSGTVLLTNSGAMSVESITGGRSGGTNTAAVILNGTNAVLDLLGGTIGTNGVASTYIDNLNFQAGTLKNVAEINGGTNLVKTGTGILTLAGTNTYSGATVVSNGTLLVQGIINTNLVTVWGGTLGGDGLIQGAVAVESGGTLAPGASIGILTVSNTVTLGGTTVMEVGLAGGNPTNDLLTGVSTLNLGGALTIHIAGQPPVGGEVFKLFNAASIVGNFTSFNFPVTPGVAFDVSRVAVDGTVTAYSQLVITQDPQPSVLVTGVGSNATFTAAAAGTNLYYQWYFDTNTLIAGANANQLNLVNLQVTNSGGYTLVVTNALGSVTSAVATLVVTNHSSAPLGLILIPAPTNTVAVGTPAEFTATVTGGSAPIGFYWYKLPNLTVPVGTGNSYTSAVVTCLSEGDAYQVVASNIVGVVTSTVAYVEVRDTNAPAFNPAVVATNVTLLQGTNFSVTVGLAVNCNLATYRWYLNATNLLASQTTPTLSLANLKLNDGGSYTLIASNQHGLSPIGTAAVLTVSYLIESPMVIVAGETFQTTVTAEPNRAYWLEARNSLTEGTWTFVLGVTNVTGPQVLQDAAAAGPYKFYRIGSAPAP